MRVHRFRNPQLAVLLAALLVHMPLHVEAQPPPVVVPPGFGPRLTPGAKQPQQQQQQPDPAKPEEAKPQEQETPVTAPAATFGGLNLQNANLLEVVDFLARELKINYIIDPRVKGGVTLNTYGEVREIDRRELLDTILRINGAAMVQAGNIYRIVPLAELPSMPLQPNVDERSIPEDDRAMLNLIFLKYANGEELAKLLTEFIGREGKVWSYPAANLLLVLDSRRNMKRTMELVAMFDSDALARQRVRIFDVSNSRPTDIARELENLMKSISMGKDLQSIRFVPVDRINILIAVAPNPGVFSEVESWLKRLDVKVDSAVGKVDTFVYRVKYGQAQFLAMSIMMLYYSLYPGYGFGGGMMGGMGGFGMMGGYPGMMGGVPGMMQGGFGSMYGGTQMMPGAFAGAMLNPYQAMVAPQTGGVPGVQQGAAAGGAAGQLGVAQQGLAGGDLTGQYLGAGMLGMGGGQQLPGPRVVPNILDNSLLILATGEEHESVLKLLRELDVPPRQVLIEARIYEVTLTGAFSQGIAAYFRRRGQASDGGPAANFNRQFAGVMQEGLSLSAGMLIGQSRELLAFLDSTESRERTRVISAPTVIATDSIPAHINVGLEVPTLQSQAVTGAQQAGSSLFANTIANRRTGVTMNITARVNPSGVVTLMVDQEVSSPQAPRAGEGIQSPSFSQRNVSTQVTIQDGDMVAIGGIINETDTDSSLGVPLLHRIPVLGMAFGSKASNRNRTELIIFLTPRVIYDTNDVAEASEELRSRMRRLQRLIRD